MLMEAKKCLIDLFDYQHQAPVYSNASSHLLLSIRKPLQTNREKKKVKPFKPQTHFLQQNTKWHLFGKNYETHISEK